FFVPFLATAAGSPFYYAGWLPFWKKESGAADIAVNLEKIHSVSPFSYEVNSNGTLRDVLKIHDGLWPEWLSLVRAAEVKIIPTVAWFNAEGLHTLLSNTKLRRAHEDKIAKLVKDEHFDGIDIDYEGKLSKTSPYFSLLIEGLAIRLHPYNKTLTCTIEARTPLDSLPNSNAPEKKPSYANDYAVLNKYCDEVRIMAYDQGTIDQKLDAEKGNGNFYAPVADPAWVEKVIKEALKSISRKKIMLGVPTYGYEYQVNWADGLTTYRRLRSVNFFTAMNRAESIGVAPVRNNAGELSFTYASSTWVEVPGALRSDVFSTLPVGLTLQTASATSTSIRFVSFSDGESTNQKIQLAKKYGLRGVVLFKFDGEFDPLIWEVMQ
ncbi:MAG: glycosyl hydrolase family 18 protein, partial [bacterium]|nr:glycosyl hydrolase family 18 protein [bacterium]